MNATKTSNRSDLLFTSTRMKASLRILKEINNKANLIAFNAAIEGARTRGRLDSFSIVAEQILTQAFRQLELTEQLEKLVNELHNVALRSTAARYYELAEDLIDMLDRNLFERNCDAQAWATFDANVKCLKEIAKLKEEGLAIQQFQRRQDDKGQGNDLNTTLLENKYIEASCYLLEKTMGVYIVYADIYCIDLDGMVVAAGKNRHLIGNKFVKDTEWFKIAVSGKVHVSDMHYSEDIGNYCVSYSAPVLDENRNIIGVLSTRFNWDYAQEMIDHGNFQDETEAFIISKSGLVLASSLKVDIYRDLLHWLNAGKHSIDGSSGHSIETARNGAPMAVGFAKTKGYNSYKGKEWAAIITSKLGNVDYQHLIHFVDKKTLQAKNDQKNASEELLKKIESEICNEELIKCMKDINELVEQINKTNNETDMLAINAAIQAGIAGTDGESFAVIAGEIGSLAEKSVGFVEEVNKTTRDLQNAVSFTVAARLSDAAKDAIEKVDRNLFERYCDVQAWATFSLVKEACKNQNLGGECSDLLSKIHQIYEVYHDILLLDSEGKIVAAGVHRELLGQNQSNHQWFQEALNGKVSVTDVYFSKSINAITMSFSAPIQGPQGAVIGVLTTRFNWKFIYDIIDAVIVDSQSQVNLINSEGMIIGSTDREEVFKKTCQHLKAFKELNQGKAGHIQEEDSENGQMFSIGFCKTKGYNTYQGKGWSVIIKRKSE